MAVVIRDCTRLYGYVCHLWDCNGCDGQILTLYNVTDPAVAMLKRLHCRDLIHYYTVDQSTDYVIQ